MIANKSLLITSSILDSFSWMQSAPNTKAKGRDDDKTWKEIAYSDFVNSLNRISTPIDPMAQRGIDFESRMTRDLYQDREFFVERHGKVLGMVWDKGHGATQQATLKTTIVVDDQPYLLYGKADLFFPDRIVDLKTTGSWKGPEKYTDRSQHLLYITASRIKNFEYLVCVGSDKEVNGAVSWIVDSVIPVDASMSVDDATDRLETRIRSFVEYLKGHPEHLDAYVNKFNR